MFCVGFRGRSLCRALRDLIDLGVSSVILFGRNIESRAQLCGLIAEIRQYACRPMLVMIDQEGGRVQRMPSPFSRLPAMREFGRSGNVEAVEAVARIVAGELRGVGIDMNLSPVLDVDTNPLNPVIGDRSFSSDPETVSRLGCAYIDAIQGTGLAACGKHFPGHGDTDRDSHIELPRLKHDMRRLEQVELVPFVGAIRHNVAAIMVSHVLFEELDPERPSSLSGKVIRGLLRGQMGFGGLVISDDMDMKAVTAEFPLARVAVQAAGAGVDLILVCHSTDQVPGAVDSIADAVSRGEIPLSRIEEANGQLDRLMGAWGVKRLEA